MIFYKRNDPNQISNLIDYQSEEESKLEDSEISITEGGDEDNNSGLYDNSFDKPDYRSDNSKVSELSVQSSFEDNGKIKVNYQSQRSYNNIKLNINNYNEDYSSIKNNGYLNFLWRRNPRESQRLNTCGSKKQLLNELKQDSPKKDSPKQDSKFDTEVNNKDLFNKENNEKNSNKISLKLFNKKPICNLSRVKENSRYDLNSNSNESDLNLSKYDNENKFELNSNSKESNFNLSSRIKSDNHTNPNPSKSNTISPNEKSFNKSIRKSSEHIESKYIYFLIFLVAKFVKPKISLNYTKEEYSSEEKEYEFMNNSNVFYQNDGSSFLSDNTIEKEDNVRMDTFQSTEFDYKLKNDFDCEYNFDNIELNLDTPKKDL